MLEQFAKRGLLQPEAVEVITLVATHPANDVPPGAEAQIRKASGISDPGVVFWSWAATPTVGMVAAFNPVECTLTFFSNPAIYSGITQSIAAAAKAGMIVTNLD